jgi:hypothetical protein
MARIGDVIEDVRWHGFVGRAGELAGFDDALAGRSGRRVLFVHGPGGIGKTTLLLHLRGRARRAGHAAVYLDGREIDPSPEGFVRAAGGGARVLLIDGYEQLGPIDGWLRHDLIPALPADNVVVLAGRDPPAPAWRGDPGWRSVVAVHPLGALGEADSDALLDRAGVAVPDRAPILRLGRGHPLALALLADAALTGTVPHRLADAPDLISALMASLVREAPSEAHLIGLATCAKAWLTTEDLLRRTVGEDAPEVWAWLRERPFVTVRAQGLTPHDLTREVLDAEFDRRSPDRYRSLHRVIHDYVVAGVRACTGMHRQLLAQHLAYLHRHTPLSQHFTAIRTQGAVTVPARPDEYARLVTMVAASAGPETAELAREWFAVQPEHTSVVRTERGISGFANHLCCPSGSPLDRRDPVVRDILEYVARAGPLRPGEVISVARFLCGDNGTQSDPYAVFAGSISSIIEWCTRTFAWSFVPTVDPEFWGPVFDYLGFRPLLETAPVDGRRHVVYGNDWRRFPVDSWLDLMNEREHSGGSGPPPDWMLRPAPLGRDAFAAAVRAALPQLHRPDRLAGCALVGSSLGADPAVVRASLRAAVDDLAAQPRGDRLRAVLHRTYLSPAPTQEAAAEALGLPFSTYRRHLARAVDELTARLWAGETGQQVGSD